MPPAKEVTKKNSDAEISQEDDAAKETTENSAQNQLECETDNEEKPLQIDTGNEAKVESENGSVKQDGQAGGNKRSSGGSGDSNATPAKKARPKPKPMKIENMKEYVDNNTIEKLTTTTLFHWLKERNLHCSTRDKKADLIQKIKNQFVSTAS